MKIHNPPMTFINDEAKALWEKGLENNQDPYGLGCYRYASELATQAENEIKKGKALNAELFERVSGSADTEGITGFMYGVAISLLCHAWVHGKALAAWHNGNYMEKEKADEAAERGQVVNPAILNFELS